MRSGTKTWSEEKHGVKAGAAAQIKIEFRNGMKFYFAVRLLRHGIID